MERGNQMISGVTRIYKMNDYLNIEANLRNGVSRVRLNNGNENPPVYRPNIDNGRYRLDLIV